MILVIDFILNEDSNFISYRLGFFSCFLKAFLDTIEKYLFEFDFLNPYKVLMLEGLFCVLFLPTLFSTNLPYIEINEFNENRDGQLALLIIFIIIYAILTLFKNIYRVLTIRFYSPMARALAESVEDPLDCFYLLVKTFFKNRNEKKKIYYYIIILIILLITSFLSFVYNDFIVLYCCGLEYNTHLEINKRAISYENINDNLIESDINSHFELEKYNEINELSVL
jgi:hypothetical protein